MIGCPQCGGSSAVEITRDDDVTLPAAEGPRWRARCADCGTAWSFRD